MTVSRYSRSLVLLVVAAAGTAAFRPSPTTGLGSKLAIDSPSDSGFTVQKLAAGVYAVVRKEPLGLINESNSMFIIGDRDVIVVDAQSSSARTRETLAALRRLTDKPVSAIINTHWHDDHVVGNEVYKAAYPNAEIIGHANNAGEMATTAVQYRKGVANRAGTISYLRGLVEKHESFLGGPIDSLEARSHQHSAWLVDDYSNASPDFRPLTPTRTVTDSLILTQGKRRVEVRFLGKGHTSGDLVVWLPSERILATGDLLMWPVQFIGSTSYPREFAQTEERVRALKAATVVPGHGKVLAERDADAHAALIVRTLQRLSDAADSAVARADSLDAARKRLDLTSLRQEMTADIRLRQALYSYYVSGAGFQRAYELAAARRSAGK
jgi:glyoxylase-like metal-dependent hydrolase (beta-lactamase superfamily II)